MQEEGKRMPSTGGIWWKSLLATWLGLQTIGVAVAAIHVEVPGAVGLAILAVVWAVVWASWRRHSANEVTPQSTKGLLWPMQRLVVILGIGMVLLGNVVVRLDADSELPQSVVLAAGVVAFGVISLVGARVWVPALDSRDIDHVLASYRTRLFARIAWAEGPALFAFAGFLILSAEAWVYGIGLAASLVGLAFAAPTRASVRRDQARLVALGSEVDLLAVMGVSADPRRT